MQAVVPLFARVVQPYSARSGEFQSFGLLQRGVLAALEQLQQEIKWLLGSFSLF